MSEPSKVGDLLPSSPSLTGINILPDESLTSSSTRPTPSKSTNDCEGIRFRDVNGHIFMEGRFTHYPNKRDIRELIQVLGFKTLGPITLILCIHDGERVNTAWKFPQLS